jgi:hypothetical protein
MAMVATTSPRRATAAGADGVTVMLLAVAAFLAILALLAWQVRSAPALPRHRVIVLRRVYETRVVETVIGAAHGGSTVTQSVSSSAPSSSASAAPTTRSS